MKTGKENDKKQPIMKKRTITLLTMLCTLCVLSSCVEEYTIPKATAVEYESEIVIEGHILAGEESVFYLSYTIPLNSDEETPDVLNARIHVVGQNGYRSEAAEFDIEDNCYVVDTRTLENNTQYAVEVTVEGETYQSDFQPLLTSPEIDEVTWQENESSVSIFVTTMAEVSEPRHFMWSYEEDWEFHAEIDMRGNDTIKPVYVKEHYPDLTEEHNPYYYGWMHNVSRNIHLHSTVNLSENLAKDILLQEIGIEDIRISYLYSILVKQWSLTDEAFKYYSTLKRYTEESEGLFTPILSDYQGNISCLTNPDKRAHGYVLASSVTTQRIFIYEKDFQHMRSQYSQPLCITKTRSKNSDEFYAINSTYPWASPWVMMARNGNRNDRDAVLYNWYCVDCRHTAGASLKRPDFWPDNYESKTKSEINK